MGLSYSSAGLYSHYLLYAFHGTEFLDECICLCCIIYHHGYVSGEQAVLGLDVDASHHEFILFGDDIRNVAHDTDIVVSDDSQGDGIL